MRINFDVNYKGNLFYCHAEITKIETKHGISHKVNVYSIENEYGDEVGMWFGYPDRLYFEQLAFGA